MKLLNRKYWTWPETFLNLFTLLGFILCGIMFHGGYRKFVQGEIIDAAYGAAMGLMLLFIYGFNNRFAKGMAKRWLEIWIADYVAHQSLNHIKMEVELAMRRAGVEVPKEMMADIPAIFDLDDRGLFAHKCPDPNCEG